MGKIKINAEHIITEQVMVRQVKGKGMEVYLHHTVTLPKKLVDMLGIEKGDVLTLGIIQIEKPATLQQKAEMRKELTKQ